MSSETTCLCCIPIKTGVKAIAWFQVAILAGISFSGLLYPSLLMFNMPMVFLYMLAFIAFFFESCYSSQKSRRNLLITYIVLIVLLRNIYYFWNIQNGKATELFCQIQESTLDETAIADCDVEGKKLLFVDAISGWVLEIYFAYVLYTYMNEPIEDGHDSDSDYERLN